jgi:glutathione S-transferase
MLILLDQDIQTREVLDWEGIHLLHFGGSVCSQKIRISLKLKGVDWESHMVDLTKGENLSEWFMGINPRGLVPVLVDNGKVIIESNDVLEYIEEKFPEPALIPRDLSEETKRLLKEEDDLHLDIRAISMRFFFPYMKPRPDEALEEYANHGTGTVGGVPDPHKQVEIEFHRDMQANNGVTDERIQSAASRFRSIYDRMNSQLEQSPYLQGEHISFVDIAWYIYTVRLTGAGYPLHRLHPAVGTWFDALDANPIFHDEIQWPTKFLEMKDVMQKEQQEKGTTLEIVAGLTA